MNWIEFTEGKGPYPKLDPEEGLGEYSFPLILRFVNDNLIRYELAYWSITCREFESARDTSTYRDSPTHWMYIKDPILIQNELD